MHAVVSPDGEGGVQAVVESKTPMASRCKRVDGNHADINFDDRKRRHTYRDESTMNSFPKRSVTLVTGVDGADKLKDAKVVCCRWALCNKDDASALDVRAKLATCEVKNGRNGCESFYAPTTPFEAKKLQFAKHANEPMTDGKHMSLSLITAQIPPCYEHNKTH